MMHFDRIFSIMRAEGVKDYNCYRRSTKLRKTCIHQKHCWKLPEGGNASPHLPRLLYIFTKFSIFVVTDYFS